MDSIFLCEGFGSRSVGGSSSSRLRHVELAFVPAFTCASSYSLASYMICAADPGQDACQGEKQFLLTKIFLSKFHSKILYHFFTQKFIIVGDSGGPLYDADNDVLIGVTSFGNGCADPDFPGVYAKVASRVSFS